MSIIIGTVWVGGIGAVVVKKGGGNMSHTGKLVKGCVLNLGEYLYYY